FDFPEGQCELEADACVGIFSQREQRIRQQFNPAGRDTSVPRLGSRRREELVLVRRVTSLTTGGVGARGAVRPPGNGSFRPANRVFANFRLLVFESGQKNFGGQSAQTIKGVKRMESTERGR